MESQMDKKMEMIWKLGLQRVLSSFTNVIYKMAKRVFQFFRPQLHTNGTKANRTANLMWLIPRSLNPEPKPKPDTRKPLTRFQGFRVQCKPLLAKSSFKLAGQHDEFLQGCMT